MRSVSALLFLFLAVAALPAVAVAQDAGHQPPASATAAPVVDEAPPRAPAWLVSHSPRALRARGPAGLIWAQWAALALVLVIAAMLAPILGRLTRSVLLFLSKRTDATWDDRALGRLGGPFIVAWWAVLEHIGAHRLGLGGRITGMTDEAEKVLLVVAVFWGALRTVDIAVERVAQSAWAQPVRSRALLPIAGRFVKVAILAMAIVAVLSELDFPIASLVTGLGVGGIIVALAAQKTFEHLLGAFAIGIDQPLREGDFVKIDDLLGTVEGIGLRSTRIRTLDRTLVSLPNGQVADKRIESYTERDRMRLHTIIGLEYGTTPEQMRAVLAGLETALREHPRIWEDSLVVQFKGLGDYALHVEVMAWFQTRDWNEFQRMRQDVLLSFMDVVQRCGTAFAFPTRTVHLVPAPGDGAPARG